MGKGCAGEARSLNRARLGAISRESRDIGLGSIRPSPARSRREEGGEQRADKWTRAVTEKREEEGRCRVGQMRQRGIRRGEVCAAWAFALRFGPGWDTGPREGEGSRPGAGLGRAQVCFLTFSFLSEEPKIQE